jgi:PST family polysaccharide transporter
MRSSRLRSLNLRKAFGLGAMQSLLRMALGFISIKVTAVWIGPSGLALVAQLNNFIALGQGLIGNPAGTAVVRLGSEYADRELERQDLLSTAMRLVVGSGLVLALMIAAGSPWLSQWLLAGPDHVLVIILAAIAIPALGFTNIVISAFNAIGELGVMSRIQMGGAVAGFIVFVPSAYGFGLSGALLATTIAYLVGALIAARAIGSGVKWADISARGSASALRKTLSFYPMLIVHAALTPLTLLLLRDRLVEQLGLETTGLWQAGWRLSEIYLALLMAPFSMYYMAKLGTLVNDRAGFRSEVLRSALRAAAVTAPVAFAIYLLRPWIVRVIFAPKFMPVVDLLPWQLLGDVVMMTAWVMTMTLTALMRARWYVACAITRAVVFVGVATLLIPSQGAAAANLGYCAASLAQIIIAATGLRDVLFGTHRVTGAGDRS